MAVTVAKLGGAAGPPEPQAIGTMKGVFAEITGDSSYPTGGEAVTPAMFGLSRIIGIMFFGPAAGHVAEYIPSTGKVLVRWSNSSAAALAEFTSTGDLSAVTFRALVLGY